MIDRCIDIYIYIESYDKKMYELIGRMDRWIDWWINEHS